MKTIYLFSRKKSVLGYWKKHIDEKEYIVKSFLHLNELYDSIEKDLPTLIFFDYDGEPKSALELMDYLHEKDKVPYVMVFNGHPLFSDGIDMLHHGAKAFMNTYAAPQNLNQAIKAVIGGNIWLYPEFIQMMIKQTVLSQAADPGIIEKLSSREQEIAQLVALGMSNKEIAKSTDITEQTVKSHLKAIYDKLRVSTRLELAILLNRDSYQSSIASKV